MKDIYKFAPMLGPADDHPPGTIEWAERISNRLQIQAASLNRETSYFLQETIEKIFSAEPPPWEIWPESKPFGTPDDYCKAVTGHSWETLMMLVAEFGDKAKIKTRDLQTALAEAQKEHRKQGAHHNNIKMRGGTDQAYLLRRLARDYPDILAAYEHGEFASVRSAAIAAGIVKVPTPLEQLRKDWKKASAQERETFLNEIQ